MECSNRFRQRSHGPKADGPEVSDFFKAIVKMSLQLLGEISCRTKGVAYKMIPCNYQRISGQRKKERYTRP